MSAEKPPSIMCSICNGWHTTEAHAQYEKEARKKRMAEIKTRPNEAYNFDTLGFSTEQKGEIEPWMRTVIEKAKELGDDLQDSDFFIHVGPLEKSDRSPSVLSMIVQPSFHDAVHTLEANRGGEYKDRGYARARNFVSEHHAGEYMESWAAPLRGADRTKKSSIDTLLELQERYVQTRSEDDLRMYQAEIEKSLQKISEGQRNRLKNTSEREDIESAKKNLQIVESLISNLDTIDGRRKAVKFIMIQDQMLPLGGEGIGIIFKAGKNIIRSMLRREPQAYYRLYSSFYYRGGEVIHIFSTRGSETDQRIAINTCDPDVAREFYKEFIHGLYVPHGSVEEQRELLKRMLEMTKDHPERRLPIYNFYGKLVWPRPPEEDK